MPYEQYTFEKFNPNLNGTHRILEACLSIDPLEDNLYILGSQGVGKTHLATAIARRVLDYGGRAKVFRGTELAASLKGRRSYATDHDQIDSIQDLASMDTIVLDDIEDGPNQKDAYIAALKVLFEHRKNQRRGGFIITSNRTLNELAVIIGAKLTERIESEFKHLVIPLETPSARKILKKIKKEQIK